MRVGEREADRIVIKLRVQPGIRVVALIAGRRESGGSVVWIRSVLIVLRVAGIALCRKPLELAHRSAFVAGFAIDCRVSADQREAVLVVANRGHRYMPAPHGMTRLAVRTELPAVNVRVAIRTLMSNVREDQLDVALRTLHFLVHAPKRITRLIVIEFRYGPNRLPA